MIRTDGNSRPDPSFPKTPAQLGNPPASGAAGPALGTIPAKRGSAAGAAAERHQRAPGMDSGRLGGVWGIFRGSFQREASAFAQLGGMSLTRSLELGATETAPTLGTVF